MMDFFKNLFGQSPKTNFKDKLIEGGCIIDVRTAGEFIQGNIKGSKNIPLDKLGKSLNSLDRSKPIITCCASGMRSAAAKNQLLKHGFSEVYNGGSWQALNRQINE